MANLEHVEIFLSGPIYWNRWRKEHPDITPNLSRINIWKKRFLERLPHIDDNPPTQRKHQFRCHLIDLSAYDLTNANLCSARLIGVNLRGAKLSNSDMEGTKFDYTNLIGAQLQNSDIRKSSFRDALLWNAKFQKSHLNFADFSNADLLRAKLTDTNLSGATFKFAKMTETDLENVFAYKSCFNYAKILKANFQNSHLQFSNFQHSDLTESNFTGTNLMSSHFEGATLTNSNLNLTNVSYVTYDNKGPYRGIRLDGAYGSPSFIRHAKDQDFIEEISEIHQILYTIWRISSDCGRSIMRWAGWSLLLALIFGVLFAQYPPWPFLPQYLKDILVWLGPDINLPNYHSPFSPYYFSIVTFTTLGFGDIRPTSMAGEIWVTIEVVLGYVMLGGLISIFANKLARRSG